MLELTVDSEPTWSVSSVELERTGPTYSVDTLEQLREQHKGDTFTLVMGQDALEDLPDWHEPEQLIQLATLAVAVRGERRQTGPELEALLPGLSKRVTWLDMPQLPFSATQVRTLASQGTPLVGFVPAPVDAYIREHRLYGAS
jgi:nicotinate-nucleotide adenylyltransferase